MKLALVHDWLNQHGGAENVLEELAAMYPQSPIYTSIYAPDRMPERYRDFDIRTTWMDRLPGIHAHHQPYVAVYPLAWQGLDLGDYEIVLSNKSGFCHGVDAGDALHICYCLTPTRFVWQFDHYVKRERFSSLTSMISRPAMRMLRRWDYRAAQRVDYFIAISSAIQRRIEKFYNRESVIIYPPVDVDRFAPVSRYGDYFLVVSRLIPYKRVDLAVEACTALDLPLIVAGDGRDREKLESIAGPTIQFVGRVADAELVDLVARCKAFIFPGLEDFGIAPVEAQAAGRPVIAFRGGGALDTVVEGKTGLFFDELTAESLIAALREFDAGAFDQKVIRANAERFDAAIFRRELAAFVDARYDEAVRNHRWG
ncbi:MAG: glycosyltransferase [Anaerolineae bacterium]|nr:glycosyltransferase [Anaerolineae bacterium]